MDFASAIYGWKYSYSIEGHSDSVHYLDITSDGLGLISGSDDNTIKVWDLETGEAIVRLNFRRSSYMNCMIIVTPCIKAIIGLYDSIEVWDLWSGEQLYILHVDCIKHIEINNSGTILVCVTVGLSVSTIFAWNLQTGTELYKITDETYNISAIAISHDGFLLITSSDTRYWKQQNTALEIINLITGELITKREQKDFSLIFNTCIACNLKGDLFAVGNNIGDVYIYDFDGNEIFKKTKCHLYKINLIVFSSDNLTLISSSYEQSIKVWDVSSLEEVASFAFNYQIESLVLHSDCMRLLLGTREGEIRVLNLDESKEMSMQIGHSTKVENIIINDLGDLSVSYGYGEIKIIDLLNHRVAHTLF